MLTRLTDFIIQWPHKSARFNHKAPLGAASSFSFTFNCHRTSLKSKCERLANCQLSDGVLMFQFRNGEFLFLSFNLQRQICHVSFTLHNKQSIIWFARETAIERQLSQTPITTSIDYWLFVCQSNCSADYRLAFATPAPRRSAARSCPNFPPAESYSSGRCKRKIDGQMDTKCETEKVH